MTQERRPDRVAVAVSGGSDSMALLHLMAQYSARTGVFLQSVTVDHRLRKGAADEAEMVGRAAAKLGVPHHILGWDDWDGRGNLQSQARQARYDLIGQWAQDNQILHVALAHTLDDQAETVLMRLARGSGVDGLSGMHPMRQHGPVAWLRPLLWAKRQELRDYLTGIDQPWADDPSNTDDRFDRVKARQIMGLLADLGLTQDRLAQTASHMAQARYALEIATQDLARRIVTLRAGNVVFQQNDFLDAPGELRDRLLAHGLGWVSRQFYKPRYKALSQVVDAVRNGQQSVLHGALIIPKKGQIWITREFKAVSDLRCSTDQMWDNRWRVSGPNTNDHEIRALGETGLAQRPDWRDLQIPRNALISSPSIWHGSDLISAPIAGFVNNWTIKSIKSDNDFFTAIITH
nr:tRNA lysidine(34) synthetase TilS [Sulfitobacter algicola]